MASSLSCDAPSDVIEAVSEICSLFLQFWGPSADVPTSNPQGHAPRGQVELMQVDTHEDCSAAAFFPNVDKGQLVSSRHHRGVPVKALPPSLPRCHREEVSQVGMASLDEVRLAFDFPVADTRDAVNPSHHEGRIPIYHESCSLFPKQK